jgi:hypothetical protein
MTVNITKNVAQFFTEFFWRQLRQTPSTTSLGCGSNLFFSHFLFKRVNNQQSSNGLFGGRLKRAKAGGTPAKVVEGLV